MGKAIEFKDFVYNQGWHGIAAKSAALNEACRWA
jgi:hypothetical protein